MKHRTDLRRAHRRIRSLERQLGLARLAGVRLGRELSDAKMLWTKEAIGRSSMQTSLHVARTREAQLRDALAAESARANRPLWRIAVARIRTWWRT